MIPAIAIWKTDQGYFVRCSERGEVSASRTIKSLVKDIEDMYMQKHMQSHVGSMSACLAYVQFQPSVLRLKLEDLVKMVPVKRPYEVRGENFGFIGLKLDDVEGAIAWDRGVKPQLIQGD